MDNHIARVYVLSGHQKNGYGTYIMVLHFEGNKLVGKYGRCHVKKGFKDN